MTEEQKILSSADRMQAEAILWGYGFAVGEGLLEPPVDACILDNRHYLDGKDTSAEHGTTGGVSDEIDEEEKEMAERGEI